MASPSESDTPGRMHSDFTERHLTTRDVVSPLEYLFEVRGEPESIRSDNGPEFVAGVVKDWLAQRGAKTLSIELGSPWENAYSKTFNSRLRDELLDREIFETLKEAKVLLEAHRLDDNHHRPHSSLGYRTRRSLQRPVLRRIPLRSTRPTPGRFPTPCSHSLWTTERGQVKVDYLTRHELTLEMLQVRGGALPHGWVADDDEMGRPAWIRKRLAAAGEQYLLVVPSNTSIRDLEAEPPPYGGQGRRPQVPFRGVRAWCETLPGEAWTGVIVRDGEKGPLEVEIVARRVESKIDRRAIGSEETLVAVRFQDRSMLKHDYCLSNAPRDTPLVDFTQLAKVAHRVEECFRRGKSEAGLGEYQVRNSHGWHHHVALSMIAIWFLVVEGRRGK